MNVCALLSLSVLSAKAQTTYMEMEQLTVNDQVTTVITASEPIRFVDISTDKVVGDQPINNTIRLKPKDNVYADKADGFGGGDDGGHLVVDRQLLHLHVGGLRLG